MRRCRIVRSPPQPSLRLQLTCRNGMIRRSRASARVEGAGQRPAAKPVATVDALPGRRRPARLRRAWSCRSSCAKGQGHPDAPRRAQKREFRSGTTSGNGGLSSFDGMIVSDGEHHLRWTGSDRQHVAVDAGAENVCNHRPRRIDHGACLVSTQCKKGHIEPFKFGCVRDRMFGGSHRHVMDTVAQKPKDVSDTQVHLIVRGQVHADRTAGSLGKRLRPQRRLKLLVQGQARPAAHDSSGQASAGAATSTVVAINAKGLLGSVSFPGSSLRIG